MQIIFFNMKTIGVFFKIKYSGDKNRYSYTVAKDLVKPPTKLMTNTVLGEGERKQQTYFRG